MKKEYELGSKEWLDLMYLEKDEELLYTDINNCIYRGQVLENNHDGKIKIKNIHTNKEEIIDVEQIMFTI